MPPLDDVTAEIEADGIDAGAGVHLNAHVQYVCLHCGNLSRRKGAMEVHEVDLRETEQDKIVLPRGASMALDFLNEHNLGMYTFTETDPNLRDVDVTVARRGHVPFLRTWASRPKQGHTNGDNHCNGYMGDIAQIFTAGAMSKGAKMSGVLIRPTLLAQFPR